METGQRIYRNCKLWQRDIIYSSAGKTKLIKWEFYLNLDPFIYWVIYQLIINSFLSLMPYCAIGITTFIIFHLRVVSAEKFHNPPQHQGKKKTNSSRYEPAYIAVFITGLKPFLLTTVLVLFAAAAWTGVISICFHRERLKRKFKWEQ